MFRLQTATILRELQVSKTCSVMYKLSNTNGKILIHLSAITQRQNIIKIELTLWRQNILKILAHSVFKMWILQETKKIALWNKRHLEERKKRRMWYIYIYTYTHTHMSLGAKGLKLYHSWSTKIHSRSAYRILEHGICVTNYILRSHTHIYKYQL